MCAILLLAACGSRGGGVGEPPAAAPPPRAPTADPPAATEPPLDPAAPPAVRLWTEPDEAGVVLHVESRGREPARLRARVALERRGEAGWEPTGEDFSVRADCEAASEACLTLAPGAELRVPAWAGPAGERRCGCEPCPTPTDGEIRFVVESCAPEGHVAHRVASPPLEL